MSTLVLLLLCADTPAPHVTAYVTRCRAHREAELAVATAEQRAKLEDQSLLLGFPEALEVGDCGVLHSARVISIADDDSMVAEIRWPVRIRYRIGRSELYRTQYRTSIVWIDGVPTAGMVDDARYEIGGVWHCESTIMYDSPLGRRTVFRMVHCPAAAAALEPPAEAKSDADR